MDKKQNKRPYEFSKKIIFCAAIVNLVIVLFTLVMVWRSNDLSPLAYLIPAAAGEMAVGTGFYYSKAKVENRIKLMKACDIKPSEESFKDL